MKSPILWGVVLVAIVAAVLVVPPIVQNSWRNPVKTTPSYAEDIQPIFDRYCVECHGPQEAEKGLRLDSYSGVMSGGERGAVVVPFQPDHSYLVAVIEQRAVKDEMPKGGVQLSSDKIANIRAWIEQGAKDN